MARQAAAATVVYPTGQYPADVQSVQAALDGGGTVLLKATNAAGAPTSFDFGPAAPGSGFVALTRDAQLTGEPGATISGGIVPVRVSAPNAAVSGLTFDGSLQFAIEVKAPNASVSLIGNRIVNVLGNFFAPLDETTAAAIDVEDTGRAVIDDNVIANVNADFGDGVAEGDATGPVDISRNQISGTTGYSIESTGLPAQGSVTIADNVLRPGQNGGYSPASGIAVNGTASYTVSRNDIVISVPVGIGISVLGAPGFDLGPVDSPVIDHNHIVLAPTTSLGGQFYDDGIDLLGEVTHAYVGQNKIEGTGESALGLYDEYPGGGTSDLGYNTYVGNDIAQTNSQLADVFLDAGSHDNVLKGFSGTVLDLGTNNEIGGFTKRFASSTELQVSEAVHLRNAALGAR